MTSPNEEPLKSPLTKTYPYIAALICEDGWIELGLDENTGTYARALDTGGLLWSGGNRKMTLEELLGAIDENLVEVFDEMGIEV